MSLFEKPRFENKYKVTEFRQAFRDKDLYFDDMPKDMLVELLEISIERIDEKENGGEFDERDWKDCLCDKEFIADELFEALQEKVDLGIYK